jgi:CubicO group peptidase (beta-lactamase class C family)
LKLTSVAQGFGYASLPSTPVTPHTLFWAGSTTKSFTAAALSLLVDNASDYASVGWQTPMSHLLREDFVLSDDWATAHVTVEDALSHRTGYPRHDLSIGAAAAGDAGDTRSLVRSLRHLPMSAEPRARFQYNNMMWAAAGYLVSALSGLELGAFFRRYLWGPMGLEETFLGDWDPRFAARAPACELADGYWWVNGTGEYVKQPREVTSLAVRADEGAGAVVSNVLDYAKYLRVMMAEAGPLSKAGHRELKRPRSFQDLFNDPFVGPTTYGLGWMSGVFEGHEVFHHPGTVTPFVTHMMMVPSKEYGIVVMSNGLSHVRELVTYRILYDLFNVDEGRRKDFETK